MSANTHAFGYKIDPSHSAVKWRLFVSANVIGNICKMLACSTSTINRSYHVWLVNRLYHMEAITFASRFIWGEIKQKWFLLYWGERLWDIQKGQLSYLGTASGCLDEEAQACWPLRVAWCGKCMARLNQNNELYDEAVLIGLQCGCFHVEKGKWAVQQTISFWAFRAS